MSERVSEEKTRAELLSVVAGGGMAGSDAVRSQCVMCNV